jgi:hypothetical protein
MEIYRNSICREKEGKGDLMGTTTKL